MMFYIIINNYDEFIKDIYINYNSLEERYYINYYCCLKQKNYNDVIRNNNKKIYSLLNKIYDEINETYNYKNVFIINNELLNIHKKHEYELLLYHYNKIVLEENNNIIEHLLNDEVDNNNINVSSYEINKINNVDIIDNKINTTNKPLINNDVINEINEQLEHYNKVDELLKQNKHILFNSFDKKIYNNDVNLEYNDIIDINKKNITKLHYYNYYSSHSLEPFIKILIKLLGDYNYLLKIMIYFNINNKPEFKILVSSTDEELNKKYKNISIDRYNINYYIFQTKQTKTKIIKGYYEKNYNYIDNFNNISYTIDNIYNDIFIKYGLKFCKDIYNNTGNYQDINIYHNLIKLNLINNDVIEDNYKLYIQLKDKDNNNFNDGYNGCYKVSRNKIIEEKYKEYKNR